MRNPTRTIRPSAWADNAACRNRDTAWFDLDVATPDQQRRALAVCSRCPVKAACLQAAGQTRDQSVIRGGIKLSDDLRWVTCVGCGSAFTANRKKRRPAYCGHACRARTVTA